MAMDEIQYQKMTETPVKRLIIKLSIPTIISMLVTSIYNLADTFFVSKLGESASGAVSVVFSLMAIIQAIGFTLGMGAGSLISAKLGEKKNDDAQKIGAMAFYSALTIGLLLTIFGLLFINPLMKGLGSTETVLPYAKAYASYILYGAPIMAGSFVLNNILRSEGKANLAMIGLVFGGLLNIALDPLFIFVFDLGISGAAIATLISQVISFSILLACFLFKKTIVTLKLRYLTLNFLILLDIVKTGLPSLFRQGLASVSTILLNKAAGTYGGDMALSAMGIVGKTFMIIFAVALGIGQGYQPVCGYNYSSKHYKRVKEAFLFTFLSMTIVMTVLAFVFYFTAPYVIKAFLNKEDVVKIGSMALRYQCLAMPLLGVNVICNMTYQSTRKRFIATLLSSLRQGLFLIPLLLILPAIFKIQGVELAQPLSDLLTCLFSIPFFVGFLKHLKKLDV